MCVVSFVSEYCTIKRSTVTPGTYSICANSSDLGSSGVCFSYHIVAISQVLSLSIIMVDRKVIMLSKTLHSKKRPAEDPQTRARRALYISMLQGCKSKTVMLHDVHHGAYCAATFATKAAADRFAKYKNPGCDRIPLSMIGFYPCNRGGQGVDGSHVQKIAQDMTNNVSLDMCDSVCAAEIHANHLDFARDATSKMPEDDKFPPKCSEVFRGTGSCVPCACSRCVPTTHFTHTSCTGKSKWVQDAESCYDAEEVCDSRYADATAKAKAKAQMDNTKSLLAEMRRRRQAAQLISLTEAQKSAEVTSPPEDSEVDYPDDSSINSSSSSCSSDK